MKNTVFLLLVFFSATSLFAQDFHVPRNYTLEAAEDYAPYEADIIACFNWIMETPPNEQNSKREDANAFLLKWISGSPEVLIELNTKIITFIESSPYMLLIFMGGWTNYALETREFDNKVAGSLAGIEAVISYYNKYVDVLGADKKIEKYIKMQQKGTLEEYIQKKA